MQVGKRYNWKHDKEPKLVYLGCDSSGWWHQFAKVDTPTVVWCGILDNVLHLIEETEAEVISDPEREAFDKAFAETGYQYGEDALDQVFLGWKLARRADGQPFGWLLQANNRVAFYFNQHPQPTFTDLFYDLHKDNLIAVYRNPQSNHAETLAELLEYVDSYLRDNRNDSQHHAMRDKIREVLDKV